MYNNQSHQKAALQDRLNQALALHQQGDLAKAEKAYLALLKTFPALFDAAHLLGVVYMQRGFYPKAVKQIQKALNLNPKSAPALSNLGNALRGQKRYEAALQAYEKAMIYAPDFFDAIFNAGIVCIEMKRFEAALSYMDSALSLQKNHIQAHLQRSLILRKIGHYEDALATINIALSLQSPPAANTLLVKGNLLSTLQRYPDAVQAYRDALTINPKFAQAHNNLGSVLQLSDNTSQAEQSFQSAITLKPDYAEAHSNLATLQLDQKRFDEALANFDAAFALNPDYNFLEGKRLYTKLFLCDWSDYHKDTKRLLTNVEKNKPVTAPFTLVALPSTQAMQLSCNRLYTAMKYPPKTPLWQGEAYKHDKIRIAYLSADYHEHPTAYLTADLFECHDRAAFETFAISFGKHDQSPMRSRLENAFDHFIDVAGMSDKNVALMLREKQIDIAVDLKGYTQNARAGILAYKPAPVQVNYLGYPATMGAEYIDYIIADSTIIPHGQEPFYDEKIIRLPHCYQPHDSKRAASQNSASKAEHGLPENAFVFCSFNNSYKITPDIFDIWMDILRHKENSVLWLLKTTETACQNLSREAQKRGIEPSRLIFAPYVKQPDHLARYRFADLFLDTAPCSAHTTASDALWAGIPVLSCPTDTFAGRVAASLLRTAGAQELVVETMTDYKELAINLAHDPDRLDTIKQKLTKSRETSPLYDTKSYTQNLEKAFSDMVLQARARD